MSHLKSFDITYDYQPGDIIGDYGVTLISADEYPITGSTRCEFSCSAEGCEHRIVTTIAFVLAGLRYCKHHALKMQYAGGKIAKYDALSLQNNINGCEFIGFADEDRSARAYGIFKCATPGCENTFKRRIDNVLHGTVICSKCRGKVTADRNRENAINYHAGDLIGENQIQLLKTVESGKHGRRALFQCQQNCPDCPTDHTFEQYIAYVVSGITTACTARAHSFGAYKREAKLHCDTDLTGMRFDHLTAIEPLSMPMRHKTQWRCKCDCGNEKITDAHTLLAGHVHACGDPLCQYSVTSYGEVAIALSLAYLHIAFVTQETFFDSDIYGFSHNPETGSRLPFDFYLPTFATCIEFDGEQHFIDTGWRTSISFENRRKYDQIKNDFCLKNNLQLIRISYMDRSLISPAYIFDLLFMNNYHNAKIYIPESYKPWYRRRIEGTISKEEPLSDDIRIELARKHDFKQLLSKNHIGAVLPNGFVILDRFKYINSAGNEDSKYVLRCPYDCKECKNNHQITYRSPRCIKEGYKPRCYSQ